MRAVLGKGVFGNISKHFNISKVLKISTKLIHIFPKPNNAHKYQNDVLKAVEQLSSGGLWPSPVAKLCWAHRPWARQPGPSDVLGEAFKTCAP